MSRCEGVKAGREMVHMHRYVYEYTEFYYKKFKKGQTYFSTKQIRLASVHLDTGQASRKRKDVEKRKITKEKLTHSTHGDSERRGSGRCGLHGGGALV